MSNLMRLRKKAGLTQTQLAEMVGTTQGNIGKYERGENHLKGDMARKVVTALGVSVGELVDETRVPIVAYVGLGAEVEVLDETPEGFAEVELQFPVRPGARGLLAKGDSEYPRVEEGDVLIVYHRVPPDEAMGRRAVVKLRNGPVLYKKVRRGSRYGLFNLESANAPLREDVDLEWAEIVEAIIPSFAYRMT